MKTKSPKSTSRQCAFRNTRGFKLAGRIDLPANSTPEDIRAFVVFCHCFTCSKATITTYRLSRQLAEAGYGVLRFDFTGLGDSEGDFAETTFTSTQDDLNCAIDFLSNNYRTPSFLMGHSLGGTTALSVAPDHDGVKGVVTVASPSEPDHVLHHFGHALTLLEQGIPASFAVAGQYFDIQPGFVEDVRNFNMQAVLSRLDKPVLVFDIENDALVESENADEIQQWVKGEVQRVTVKNSDHLLSDRAASTRVGEQIIAWLRERRQGSM